MPIIRSISGIRGTLDVLDNELIIGYTQAFLEISPPGSIVVGFDGRQSGKPLVELIENTIINDGRDVISLGISPTPTIQLLTELNNSAGGISITASHNDSQWNGLKFINKNGVFLDFNENCALWYIYDKSNKITNGNVSVKKNIGEINRIDNSETIHINEIFKLNFFSSYNILEQIRRRRYRIVVDAVNASGSKYLPSLLNFLNCEVIEFYCNNNGIFPHNPEPLPENLQDLMTSVVNYGADLGIAVDPDADRLVLVDNEGNSIGEEKTIVIAIESVLDYYIQEKNNSGLVVVVNQSTTQLVDLVANRYKAKVIRSAVGEINVVKAMQKHNAVIGGEGSGGVIFPECHYGRDSLIGIALILSLLTRWRLSLSQLANSYPKFYMEKKKYEFDGNFESLKSGLVERLNNYSFNDIDGIKAIKDNTWIQIRKSNTEPIIRVICESDSYSKINELKALTNEIIKNVKKSDQLF